MVIYASTLAISSVGLTHLLITNTLIYIKLLYSQGNKLYF